MTTAIAIVGCGVSRPGQAGSEAFSQKEQRDLPLSARLAIASARAAMSDGGVLAADWGVAVGTNFAASAVLGAIETAALAHGLRGVRPHDAPYCAVNLAASAISIHLGLRAFNLTLVDPWVAGIDALGAACRALRRGRAAATLAGAVEGPAPTYQPHHPPVRPAACLFALRPLAANTVPLPSRGWINAYRALHLPDLEQAANRKGSSERLSHLINESVESVRKDAAGSPLFIAGSGTGVERLARAFERATSAGVTDLTLRSAHDLTLAPLLALEDIIQSPAASAWIGAVNPWGQAALLHWQRHI